jgi:hypothetical protein
MAQGTPGVARQASRVLLAKEKIFTKEGARPAQCCMPRVKVEKNYVLMARTVRNRSLSFSMSVAMSAKHDRFLSLEKTLTPSRSHLGILPREIVDHTLSCHFFRRK